jgi:hypothetical protein
MQKGVQGFGGAHRHYHYAVDGAMHLCLAVYGRLEGLESPNVAGRGAPCLPRRQGAGELVS